MTRQDAINWCQLTHSKVPAGKYEITRSGVVRNATTKHVLTNSVTKSGYTQVCLTVAPMKTLSIKTHRLVAETFIPNPNGYRCINHIDEVKTNNQVSNLEWCDHNYNNHYSKGERSGFYKSLIRRGIGSICRFTDEDIEDMKMFKAAGIKQRDIARVYGTSDSYVCNLTRGNITRSAV